jgi:hypothetical protein
MGEISITGAEMCMTERLLKIEGDGGWRFTKAPPGAKTHKPLLKNKIRTGWRFFTTRKAPPFVPTAPEANKIPLDKNVCAGQLDFPLRIDKISHSPELTPWSF